jgi:hypothetical protein
MRRTPAEAQKDRARELTEFAREVKEYDLTPEMDVDARALYWVGPWDHKRFVQDEKGKYKKDEAGNSEFIIERDALPAIHIYLAEFRLSPHALRFSRWGFWVAGAHRCLGYLEDKKLLTSRVYRRNWHPKLHGWTVNLHILRNAERFGFEAMELNDKLYTVDYLLTCPPVARKDSGGYEQNLLLIDPDNKPVDPLLASTDPDET